MMFPACDVCCARSAHKTTTLIESFVTPCAVAPPLSSPVFQGFTHGGAVYDGNFRRFVVGSQFGPASAAALPTPGADFPDGCAANAVVAGAPTHNATATAIAVADLRTCLPAPRGARDADDLRDVFVEQVPLGASRRGC